jgi:hypothetical protein
MDRHTHYKAKQDEAVSAAARAAMRYVAMREPTPTYAADEQAAADLVLLHEQLLVTNRALQDALNLPPEADRQRIEAVQLQAYRATLQLAVTGLVCLVDCPFLDRIGELSMPGSTELLT